MATKKIKTELHFKGEVLEMKPLDKLVADEQWLQVDAHIAKAIQLVCEIGKTAENLHFPTQVVFALRKAKGLVEQRSRV